MIAVLANILAPHDPYAIFTARQAPDAQFLFGTDDKGRDVLSRMMYGARYSLIIGLGATAFALICGSIIGAVAAVSRKWVSEVIMRVLDVVKMCIRDRFSRMAAASSLPGTSFSSSAT